MGLTDVKNLCQDPSFAFEFLNLNILISGCISLVTELGFQCFTQEVHYVTTRGTRKAYMMYTYVFAYRVVHGSPLLATTAYTDSGFEVGWGHQVLYMFYSAFL